jgi:hypothetical protein
MSELQTLTLSLSEEGILHHSKLVYEEDELSLDQELGENVFQMLLCRNILELNFSLMHTVSDEVVHNLNMIWPVVKNCIL